MSENVNQFNALVEEFKENFDAFSAKGNKAAGTRARKALLELGKLTKVLRTEIQEAKNSK